VEEKLNEGIPEPEEDDLSDLTADDVELIEEQEEDEEAKPPRDDEKAEVASREGEISELNDRYLRLYAEFDNYKKRVARDKEELVRYANESLIYELLPPLDTMEIALKHAEEGENNGLVEGVKNTLREIYRTLEKFGVSTIEARGEPFNPEYHHAMSREERGDMDENMVVEEFRKGFMYDNKVLRASLVSVSTKPEKKAGEASSGEKESIGNPEE
jgi:molecular chaperone GrpE